MEKKYGKKQIMSGEKKVMILYGEEESLRVTTREIEKKLQG